MTNPDGPWIKQVAKNLTSCDDGFLNEPRYLLLGRYIKFTAEFQGILKQSGVEPVLLPFPVVWKERCAKDAEARHNVC